MPFPHDVIQRVSPVQRFVTIFTIFSEGGFPPSVPSDVSFAPAALRLARALAAAGPLGPLQRALERLLALSSARETDRLWHTSETVYKQVVQTLAPALSAEWRSVYLLSGWGEPPEDAGFALQLRFPNGNVLRATFGGAPSDGPQEMGWTLEVARGQAVFLRLAAQEVIRWILGVCRAAARSLESISRSWPELLDAPLEWIEGTFKTGPRSISTITMPAGPSLLG